MYIASIAMDILFVHAFSSRGQGSQIDTSADDLVGQRGDGDPTT